MPGGSLTRDDIIETTGVEKLEELEDLEILFLSFKEIGSLQHCPNLRRLSLIDNGLEKISNLSPVSYSLKVLCLCDQNITTVDNLELPNLRELYLHRNNISQVNSLSKCARLRKLWLFQNNISSANFFCNLGELEEAWLQCNQIKTLSDFAHNKNLKVLNLSANPIDSLIEIKQLLPLSQLSNLSFYDIHFGKCNIVDEEGYRSYIILLLKQVQVLDGVGIKREHVTNAENDYYQQIKEYNESLREIEDSYQKSLRTIDIQHQTRESYSQVLEKEMHAALRELQGLVNEGRSVIQKETSHILKLLDQNCISFQQSMDMLASNTLNSMQQYLQVFQSQYAESMFLLNLLLTITSQHNNIVQKLLQYKQQRSIAFSIVHNSSADFLFVANGLNPASNNYSQYDASQCYTLELAKLYKVILPNNMYVNHKSIEKGGEMIGNDNYTHVFAILSVEEWEEFVIRCHGNWQTFKQNAQASTQIFSDDPAFLATLCSPYIPTPPEFLPHEGTSTTATGSAKLSESKIASPKRANQKNGNSESMKDNIIPKPVIIMGFEVNMILAQIDHGNAVKTLPVPPSDHAKKQLVDLLQGASPASSMVYNVANMPHTHVYTIPPISCDMSMQLEYICLCIQDVPLNPASSKPEFVLRGLEAKLELLLLPTHHVQSTSQLLNEYEKEASDLMQHYMVKMLEEVDEAQAQAFQAAERQVQQREQALKSARDEIENERRKQEVQLRELRSISANSNGNQGASKSSNNRRG